MGTEDKVQNFTASTREKLQAVQLGLIVRGEHSDPFGILGPHWITADGKRSLAIRVFRPKAVEVTIIRNQEQPNFRSHSYSSRRTLRSQPATCRAR